MKPPRPRVDTSTSHLRNRDAQRVNGRLSSRFSHLKADPYDTVSTIAVDVVSCDGMSIPRVVWLDCDVGLPEEGEEGDDGSANACDFEWIVPVGVMDDDLEHVKRDRQLAVTAAWTRTLLGFDD